MASGRPPRMHLHIDERKRASMQSRREFGKLALTGLSLSAMKLPELEVAKIDSTVKGVKLGLITGSLNPLPEGKDPIDAVIARCLGVGGANIDLVNVLEPRLVDEVSSGQP